MMIVRKQARRGSTALATLLLLVSAGVATFAFFGNAGGGGAVGSVEDALFGPEPQAGGSLDGEAPGRDLLAVYGSYDPHQSVGLAFAAVESAETPPAPLGETATGARRWTGADPPELHVGVILVAAGTRRAVVDGTVVGVGDRIGRAVVTEVVRDTVVVAWMGRRLTYDLDGAQPREFRAELARRNSENKGDEAVPAASQEGSK